MSRRRPLRLALLIGLLGVSSLHARQVCEPGAGAPSSPSARFTDPGEGVLVDEPTQLMWMRCAVGQSWREPACEGTATRHSLAAAQALAEQVNRSGSHFFNDWRLPTLRELATISERQCRDPRINLAMFPGTPPATFWTLSPRVSNATEVYVMDFARGGVGHDLRDGQHHVRLVRNAP